ITGFNTDIEHGGTTYHVQTEDKGLDTPIILSLVYVGGAILASKRAPYDDLIAEGFDEGTLTERLQRQHKLICAAVKAGRVDDLKRMGQAEPEVKAKKAGRKKPAPAPAPAPSPSPAPIQEEPQADFTLTEADIVIAPPADETHAPPSMLDLLTEAHALINPEEEIIRVPILEILPPVEKPPPPPPPLSVADIFLEQEAEAAATAGRLYLKLLDDEGDFRAGQFATIKIYAGRGRYGRSAVGEAEVTVKVLGTTFRPLLLSTKTNEEGVAVVRAILPRFTSGRAAILIRAVAPEGDTAELRRIIHQA
ncbi:MAG TPA: hypothetical protein VFX96_16485, partial [Pyrinomonadaceae bacterium]|nr:hypothetical protein [Pyrinomonadaceae bacterium]